MKPAKILYAGNDLALPNILDKALSGFQSVRSPDENTARLFLKYGLDYALILADETLPDGAGLSLGLCARSLARYARTHVVILSGDVRDVGGRVRFVRTHDHQFLSKTVRELTTAICV